MFVQMTYPAFETKSQVHKPSRTHDDTSGFGNQLAKVPRSKKAREKVNHNLFGTNRHSSIANDKKRERGIAEVLLQKFLKRNTEELTVFSEEETSKQKTQRFRFFI